jgi:tetratricopeptide (TPR) repeat protein
MAKIALRVYNHEIEGQIEGGQLDEAIAHCQHILKTFPMHLETYRLLGKTFLEARRYGDATDIFQRILQAVPDDFVSHVGMSIIRDDENKLDDAIWHMERAFEVQPSNPAIQGELRRLYGRRDGVEPPKIRLTRDALANMYVQGELFNQAITEIRSVLAEDPNRPDLQVMLARAYYRSGQKVEAAEMAIQLLKKYPNCMDALRILVDVLPGTTRSEETQVYRQRLLQLDPYAAFVTGTVFQTSQVADASVNLEKLLFEPSAVPASGQDWAASLGVKFQEDSAKPPEWLTAAATAAGSAPQLKSGPTPASEPAPDRSPAPAARAESVPDWLREAGWQESAGEAQEGPMDFSAEPEVTGLESAEPIAKGEIPSWIQSMAPQEVKDSAAVEATSQFATEQPAATGSEDNLSDWLAGLGGIEEKPAPLAQPAAETGIPDWLQSMKPAASFEEPAPVPDAQPAVASDMPDWLKDMKSIPDLESAPVEPAQPADDLPTWLQDMKSIETPQPTPATPAPAQPAPVRPAAADGSAPIGPTGPSTPLGIEDDAMAWLESLALKQGARPDELLTRPEDRPTEAPASVQNLAAQAVQPAPVTPKPVAAPAQPAPARPAAADGAAPLGPTGPSTPLGIEDDAMAWLESLALKQGARPDELLTRPEDRPTEAPASVQNLAAQAAQPAPATPKPVAAPVPAPPAPVRPAAADGAVPLVPTGPSKPLSIEDDAMAWLESLALKQGARPDELLTRPEDRPTEAPASVQNIAAQAAVEPQPVSVEPEPVFPMEAFPPAEEDSVSSWLKELDRETSTAVPAPAEEISGLSNDLPEWLKGLERPAAKLEPVAASDELPEWLRTPSTPVPGEDAPVWARDESTPVQPLAPTAPEEWVPVEKAEQVLGPVASRQAEPVEKPKPALVQPVQKTQVVPEPIKSIPPKLGGTGMLSRIPAQDKEADTLMLAQNALDDGKLNASMQIYARLIKKARLLDEVIHDLREAIYRYPVDVIIWQTLGDACMRANHLQEALDAYTKAEELLR